MIRTRTLRLRQARMAGALAIAAVFLLQAFNSFGCYRHTFAMWLQACTFLMLPMLPAFIGLLTRNPLRAVGASALFAPWLPYAFYVDCVLPYRGGGASMVYVGVVMFGLPCAVLGALIAGPVSRWLGLRIEQPR